jgi:acetyl-CoA carboxylase biotin carboxyl carrier protein
VELDFNELRDLITVINQTNIAEFTLKSGEFELVVRKEAQSAGSLPPVEVPAISALPDPVPVLPAPVLSSPASPAPPAASPLANDKLLEIISPMVGTFYRAPAPDEPPFVEVGDRVRIGQTVCIIEAMKLMNEIEAEISGEVVEILVSNGNPVEYGQVLMRINPN